MKIEYKILSYSHSLFIPYMQTCRAHFTLQKPLEDEKISSTADTFHSRAGDSVVQVVPYVKGPQGS